MCSRNGAFQIPAYFIVLDDDVRTQLHPAFGRWIWPQVASGPLTPQEAKLVSVLDDARGFGVPLTNLQAHYEIQAPQRVMHSLRTKIEPDGPPYRYLVTLPGDGSGAAYRLARYIRVPYPASGPIQFPEGACGCLDPYWAQGSNKSRGGGMAEFANASAYPLSDSLSVSSVPLW